MAFSARSGTNMATFQSLLAFYSTRNFLRFVSACNGRIFIASITGLHNLFFAGIWVAFRTAIELANMTTFQFFRARFLTFELQSWSTTGNHLCVTALRKFLLDPNSARSTFLPALFLASFMSAWTGFFAGLIALHSFVSLINMTGEWAPMSAV